MSVILDKLFVPQEIVESGMSPISIFKQYINIKNIFPSLIAMVLLRLLMFPAMIVYLTGIGVFVYYSYLNMNDNNKKLTFLNNILFNGNEQPFETKSYLQYDPKLIDFYYKNRWYIDSNLTAYRRSLESTNNLLNIEYNLTQNLMKYPEQLYENAYLQYKEALNSLHSSIYKMISQPVNDDIFNDNLTILKDILNKHIRNIQNNVIKCGYNLYNINYKSIINPSNLEEKNDIKTKEYSPHYSFF